MMMLVKKTLWRLWVMLAVVLAATPIRADLLPPSCYAQPAAGTYYLYNVTRGLFLERLSNNFPGLSGAPAEVLLAETGGGYTLRFSDGMYLKTGAWNSQYLWTDGTAGAAEAVWTFEAVEGEEGVYRLKRTVADTWDGVTGVYYANGTNASTTATDDCRWALVDLSAYYEVAKANAIPAHFRSDIPAVAGKYYLYNILSRRFLNTVYRTMTDLPETSSAITPSGSSFLVSGAEGKYLKIGVYRGQYLWSDGDAGSTNWTIAAPAGGEAERIYYVYSDDFSETNAEVAGKTMYLTGTNASASKPANACWALISESDYVDYLSSGEGAVDASAVAANKAAMAAAKGDATSLLLNPDFERSSLGWWGGERGLCQLYRGSGYAFEASGDGSVMVQSVRNMPKGTYKVVAAVRGAVGTVVSARLAENWGDPVVCQGAGSVADQLNMNGVKMPYSATGGFTTADDGRGWDWATATATLHEDGHLKVEFVSEGDGKVSVADVRLYYMGDGVDAYAVDYQDGVDARNHAVACDFVAANPNRLFTSNEVLATVTGDKLNNNLVGGTVANLVLYDGHDFAADADFIATKATFYCNLPAGTLATLCLPFTVTGGADGVCYLSGNLRGNTLSLNETASPEAGRAYFFRAAGQTSALTGSGTVKAAPLGGSLVGVYAAGGSVPEGSYVVSGSGFKRVGNNVTPLDAFRAYFVAESEASQLSLDFEGDGGDGIWQRPQVATTSFVTGRDCYLYNVDAGRFYCEGNSYGTQASIGETGQKVKFVENGGAVKLTNYSDAASSWRTTFVTTNGAMYVDGETVTECNWQVVPTEGNAFKLLMASPNESYNQTNYPGAMMGLDLFGNSLNTRLAALLFADEEPGEGVYLTDWALVDTVAYAAYQTAVAAYKTALQLKAQLDEAEAASIDVGAERAVYENTASTLEALTQAVASVTRKLIEDELSGASPEKPLDLTDRFVANPRYDDNDNAGWNGPTPGIDAAANLQNAELFNMNYDYYQDLVGLPEGYYRLSLQGFYRAGLEGPSLESKLNGTEETVMHAVLYAQTGGEETVTKMQSVFTGAPSEALGVSGEIHNGDWWVPNNMLSAAAYFAAGYYQDNHVVVYVADGTMRIGIRKAATIRRDWTMFDNWKLEYLGKNAE